jgi:type I restriction enzyme M protein
MPGKNSSSLDITWPKDKSLADLDNLPDPSVLAEEKVFNYPNHQMNREGINFCLNATQLL